MAASSSSACERSGSSPRSSRYTTSGKLTLPISSSIGYPRSAIFPGWTSMMAVVHHAEASASCCSGVFVIGSRRRDRRCLGFQRRIVELAEQLLVGRAVFSDRHRDPRGVHVVLEVHVLGHDVAAPGAAAQTRG